MSTVPDFSDTNVWIIQTTVNERYCGEVTLERGVVEIRRPTDECVLITCPVFYRPGAWCEIAIIKAGAGSYRSQFYYRGYEMFGTGQVEYDDLARFFGAMRGDNPGKCQADHVDNQSH